MSKGDPVPPMPDDAPAAGEVFKHYKGDEYKVVSLALYSEDDEWIKDKLLYLLSVLRADAKRSEAGERWAVVYEPMYPNPAAKFFARPLREWREVVDWEGNKVERFTKVA